MMLRNILKTVLTNVALIPLGLIAGIFTARFLGPSDRGLLTLLLLVPATATVLIHLGMDAATIYYYKKEKADLAKLFSNSLLYALVASCLASATIWLGRDYLAASLADVRPIYLLPAIAVIPLRMFNHCLSGVIKAKEDFTTYNLRSIFERLLIVTGLFLVFFLFDGTLLQCLIVYPVVRTLICLWLLFDVRKHMPRFSLPDLALMRKMLLYAVKSYAQMLAKHIHFRADIYLVAVYLTNAEIAFYSIGAHLAERVLMVPTAVGTVLFPRLSALGAESAAQLTARACRNLLLLGLVTACCIVLVAEPLIKVLYGQTYVQATGPLYIMIFGVACVSITRNLATYLKSINKHQYNVYLLIAAAILNIVLNFLLIPKFGILGAAASSLITYSLQTLLALVIFIWLTKLPAREILFFGAQDLKYLMGLKARLTRGL